MLPIAVITFLEGLRSRVLFGIFLFAIFVMVLSIIFANFFMRDIAKVAVDFNLSAISFSGLLLAVSLTVNLIAKDLEKRTIYFVLARPVSRSSYILGKYCGIMLLTLFAYCILTLLSSATLLLLQKQYINYFGSFRWPAYLLGVFFDFVKIGLLNAVIIFFSTITTSSFITLLFSVSIYIIGQSLSDVINYLSLNQQGIVVVSSGIKRLIGIVKYVVPNFDAFDFKLLAAHGISVPLHDVLLFTLYGFSYTGLLLFLASLFFSRKVLA